MTHITTNTIAKIDKGVNTKPNNGTETSTDVRGSVAVATFTTSGETYSVACSQSKNAMAVPTIAIIEI